MHYKVFNLYVHCLAANDPSLLHVAHVYLYRFLCLFHCLRFLRSCIERQYDISQFGSRVSRYPFCDHQAPPLPMMGEFCKDAVRCLPFAFLAQIQNSNLTCTLVFGDFLALTLAHVITIFVCILILFTRALACF